MHIASIVLVVLAVTSLVLSTTWSLVRLARASYRSGQRAALIGAIKLVEMRQDTATQLAPRGKLAVGLLRAGEAHAIEMDLREELNKLKRSAS